MFLERLVTLLAMMFVAGSPGRHGVIRGKAGPSEIVITTTERLAGAIDSLTWNGKEFINSADHGRQLQSASNFDCGKRLLNETYNPTEAGSRRDGAGPKSSSKLLTLHAEGNTLETSSRMAFWLAPGEKSGENPAYNTTVLSDHGLSKRVRIDGHAIAYDVTFYVPEGERHHHAVFEALTGYMPQEFNTFWAFDEKTSTLTPLGDGPGEQPRPVVLATKDGRYAMGVIAPGLEKPGYGRFRFDAERVVKWNCVFRVTDRRGIKAGDYHYKMIVAVGTLEDVRSTLAAAYMKNDRG